LANEFGGAGALPGQLSVERPEIGTGAEVGAHQVVGAEGGPCTGTEDLRAVDIVHVNRNAQDTGQTDEVRPDVALAMVWASRDSRSVTARQARSGQSTMDPSPVASAKRLSLREATGLPNQSCCATNKADFIGSISNVALPAITSMTCPESASR